MSDKQRKFMDEIHMDDRYQPLTHGAFVQYKTDSGQITPVYLSKVALEQILADIELKRAQDVIVRG
ncbi:hypothetical protein [Bacillus sp. 7894-2]|uniref:hypothetical protein n=1 Tax=Bacillus sp. 7894-2 TaxID=2021695 RepID=UPI000BA6AD3B|nr:hypothetical protein [Bacillus sp. 7894-2]PAE24053.1 hypothetical protein CHI10_14715 [Bacillus sp. 7894-2]